MSQLPGMGFTEKQKEAVNDEVEEYGRAEVEKAAKLNGMELRNYANKKYGVGEEKEVEKKEVAKKADEKKAIPAKKVEVVKKEEAATKKAAPASTTESGIGKWFDDFHARMSPEYRKERRKKTNDAIKARLRASQSVSEAAPAAPSSSLRRSSSQDEGFNDDGLLGSSPMTLVRMKMLGRVSKHRAIFFNRSHQVAINLPKGARYIQSYTDLSPFWQQYFNAADKAIKENFWGSLSTLKKAHSHQDAYAKQLEEIGYRFDKGNEQAAPFYQTIKWALEKIDYLVKSNQIKKSDVLLPGKAFEVQEGNHKKHLFICLGDDVPKDAKELNLLPPNIFVNMLAQGFSRLAHPFANIRIKPCVNMTWHISLDLLVVYPI